MPTSYANRRGYGTHRALRRFARACRDHRWILQADIRLYFPSIDHRLLLGQLEQLIACPGTLWLLRQILANGACGGPAIDLPGIRACLRYVDDLALFADRPEPLREALAPLRGELSALRLRLHPSKTRLLPTVHGASFVGFHIIRGRIRLRYHSLLRIRRGLRRCDHALAKGGLREVGARASALSWNAHLAHGHTIQLRRRLFAPHGFAAGLPPLPAVR